MDQIIKLKNGQKIITENNSDAYHVLSGTVFVYMVPYKDEEVGRRALICVVSAGQNIPCFSYRDKDYCDWKFLIMASSEAELMLIPMGTTKPLKEKFAKKSEALNYRYEGFEEGMLDKYRMILAREDAYFIKTCQEKDIVKKRTDDLIQSIMDDDITEADYHDVDDELYKTVAMLCNRTHIPIESFGKISQCTKGEMTINDIARVSGFSVREILLDSDWYKKDIGIIFAYTYDKQPVACIPKGQNSYNYILGGVYKGAVREDIAKNIDPKAYMLYRPLPDHALTWRDVFKYSFHSINKTDLISMLLLTVIVSGINLVVPSLTEKFYDKYIPAAGLKDIYGIGLIALSFIIGAILFSCVKGINSLRLSSHIKYDVQNAIYQRVYSFPESFFRKYESADLNLRIMTFGDTLESLVMMSISMVVFMISALLYICRMLTYSLALSVIGIAIVLVLCTINLIISRMCMKYEEMTRELNGSISSKLYQFICGIDKIHMAGVEDRALYEYLYPLTVKCKALISQGTLRDIQTIISTILNGLIPVLYYIFLYYQSDHVSLGTYVAFTTAFGMASSALSSMAETLTSTLMMKSVLDRAEPILSQETENNSNKVIPEKLQGNIDIDHVSFSYENDDKEVLHDVSIHINEGEYIGIVGKSGSGKTTLFKLLLGFEKPTSGNIYYDNQGTDSVDMNMLRNQLGVVLQDGRLISGSIYENIVVTHPETTVAEVEEVLKTVSLKADVDAMPMGIHTIMSENSETISGGQKQRILIARALIGRPKILLMDEATSALDNSLQSSICDTFKQMDCTKIVIAHRLSTIKDCDRIIVVDDGRIAEEGSYETLMSNRGLFYELSTRQII